MNEPMSSIASAPADGIVRRQANEIREINEVLQLQINRLEAVQVRMYGPSDAWHDPGPQDSPPEPVRNDLEELQYQIATYREANEKLTQVTNVIVEM